MKTVLSPEDSLTDAIEMAGPDTVIVVGTEARKTLALIVARRMGDRKVTVEVEEQ